jgi:circadian clock protein KaiC
VEGGSSLIIPLIKTHKKREKGKARMEKPSILNSVSSNELPKNRTGIRGFDDITFGGIPHGRPTLVCGGAGSGKTLFGMEFLVRGALEFGEQGVFMSFEESESDLVANFKSLGFDLKQLQEERKIVVDYIHIDRSEIEETGEYNLDGLFIRIAQAVHSIGAKRVVFDTLEALFSGFSNTFILRSEIRRLFRWLKDQGLTAVITAERGDQKNAITRHGLEEYVSDCVIVLDHRIKNQISTRRLRVVKFRGASHGTNEYPFLIDEGGMSVLPITSVGLDYNVSSEHISTGIPRLDTMFSRGGFFRGSSVLISGTAGTGKTSFAVRFANESCRNGEKCLYYAFEESSSQIIRNMRSTGIDLEPWVKKGLLRFKTLRPHLYGLEMHLTTMYKTINEFNPTTIVMDPISNLISVGDPEEVKVVLMRLVDLLKSRLITSVFTSLTSNGKLEETENGVSSIMDTWIVLKEIESSGERNRGLYIIKSRGMGHSNQIREFLMTDSGIDLVDVYTGPEGFLTGTARIAQKAREKAKFNDLEQEIERQKREFERKRQITEARITLLRMEIDAEQEDMFKTIQQHESKMKTSAINRKKIARLRKADDIE